MWLNKYVKAKLSVVHVRGCHRLSQVDSEQLCTGNIRELNIERFLIEGDVLVAVIVDSLGAKDDYSILLQVENIRNLAFLTDGFVLFLLRIASEEEVLQFTILQDIPETETIADSDSKYGD